MRRTFIWTTAFTSWCGRLTQRMTLRWPGPRRPATAKRPSGLRCCDGFIGLSLSMFGDQTSWGFTRPMSGMFLMVFWFFVQVILNHSKSLDSIWCYHLVDHHLVEHLFIFSLSPWYPLRVIQFWWCSTVECVLVGWLTRVNLWSTRWVDLCCSVLQ